MSTTTSDVSITLTDDIAGYPAQFINHTTPIGVVYPIGATIRYGINTIPYASLELSPKNLNLICDIEKYRRRPVRLDILSKNGCLTFNGLIDGISITQAIGDMRMSLVVKNAFQLLNEINPKLVGYHSSGIDFTKRINVLRLAPSLTPFKSLVMMLQLGIKPNLDKTLFAGVVDLLKSFLNSQIDTVLMPILFNTPQMEGAIAAAKEVSLLQTTMGVKLLDSINCELTKSKYTLGDYRLASMIFESISSTKSNLYEVLLAILDSMACALVIGNKTAFIVPNTGFLKQKHESGVKFKKYSAIPNIVYPAQYNNVSFNDSGFRDIRGVYVQGNPANTSVVDGWFMDPSGGLGGIVGEYMPYALCFYSTMQKAEQRKLVAVAAADSKSPNTPLAPVGNNSTEAEQKLQVWVDAMWMANASDAATKVAATDTDTTIKETREFANEWAKIRYCQLKYGDRTGGISGMFNPNFAPGCLGSVFLRRPGVYIDFLVTDVVHELRMSAPDTGVATTNLGFNCGRIGSLTSSIISAGVDKLGILSEFDADSSAKIAQAFVTDVRGSAQAVKL